MENIKNKFIESVKWNYINQIIKTVAQIAFTVILTRLLSPDDFGLFAIAMIIISFGNMLSDFGLGDALIQKKELLEEDIRFVSTLQIIFGFSLTIIVYIISPFIASFFNNTQVEGVIIVLSLIFAIQSIGLTSSSLLKRDLDFKILQKIDLISHFVSYMFVGIPLAYMSYGVWSLVFAQLLQISMRTILILMAKRHTVKPLLNSSDRKYLLTFGTKNISNNILNWSINSIPNIFVGHFQSVAMLGFFERSLTLSRMPMDAITGGIHGVLFPFYSRIQDNKEIYKITFFGASTFLSLLLFPIFITIALVPETIIYAMFGLKWKIAAEVLPPLALAMPFQMLMALGGPLLWGGNKGGLEIKAQFYSLIFMIVIMYFLSQISLILASWGLFISFLIRLYFVNRYVLDFVNTSWMEWMKAIIKPILLGVAVAFPVEILDYQLTELLLSPIVILLLDILFAGGLLVSLLFVFMTHFVGENIYFLIEKNKAKVPEIILKKLGMHNE